MKRKILIAPAVLATILVAASIAYALLMSTVYVPTTWQVNANVDIQVSINGTLWSNGSTFDWGFVHPASQVSYDLSVVNLGTQLTRLTLVTTDLPLGYTITWSSNNTITPIGGTVTGDLTLTTPLNATDGSGNMYIISEEVT